MTMRKDRQLVAGKDLLKGVTYYLTGDFWPHGGTPVQLKRRFIAKDEWPGTRGEGVILQSDNGVLFLLHPKAFLFAKDQSANEPTK